MFKKRVLYSLLLFVGALVFADQKAETVAKSLFALKKAKDSFALTTMLIIDKNQNKKTRKMETYTRETSEGTDSFILFLEPADVKDTKFLTIAHKGTDDEQRIYLPALGKVRRISSSSKNEKFMGSDLNYYDLEDHSYDDYTYNYVKQEMINNINCDVIEMIPVDPNAPYSKQVAWISKENNFMYKAECYDKKSNSLIKTITFAEVKDYSGVLIATIIDVNNVKDGTRTVLKREQVKINSGVKDSIFTLQNLTR